MELLISAIGLVVFFAGCALYLRFRASRNERLSRIQAAKPIRTTGTGPTPQHLAARRRQWEEEDRLRKERERILREHDLAVARAKANGDPPPPPPTMPGAKK